MQRSSPFPQRRLLARALAKVLGQPVVAVNAPMTGDRRRFGAILEERKIAAQ